MKQFLHSSWKFALVGGLGVVVNMMIFNLLLLITWFDQHVIWANILGFVGGVINNYWLNYAWTFHGRGSQRKHHIKLLQFTVIALTSLVINTGVFGWLVHHEGLNRRIANVVAIIVVSGINYLGNYFITFRN